MLWFWDESVVLGLRRMMDLAFITGLIFVVEAEKLWYGLLATTPENNEQNKMIWK